MTEIYWLQRLGTLSEVFSIGLILCACVAVVVGALLCMIYATGDLEEKHYPKVKRQTKRFLCVFAFFAIGYMFLPTTKELYAIYGIGGTIDYIKSNDKAKQLPDKVIDALTRYVDSVEKDNEKDSNK